MDYNLSCTSSLPWIWVVEALALSNRANVSLLLDLLKRIPEISNNLGRNARELMSLRVLENIVSQGTKANPDLSSSVSSEKISLNPSDFCEDVLRQILAKSPSNLRFAGLEISKWDLQPFIEHKRSNLGKCALKELKDAILRESQPFPALLKKQSGLQIANQPEHEAAFNDGNLEGNYANRSHLMPEDSLNQNFVPASRKRRAMSDKVGEVSVETQILSNRKLQMKSPKKLKVQGNREGFCDPQRTDDGENIFEGMSQRNWQIVGEVEEAVNISIDSDRNNDEREKYVSANASKTDSGQRCNLEKRTDVDGMGQNKHTSLEGVVGLDEVLPPEKHDHDCGVQVLNDKFDGGQREDPEDGNEEPMSMNVPNTSKAEYVNISNDSDGSDDEETRIDTKKMTFLNSQCMPSQDSLATTQQGELDLCVKCKKGGNLLVCSSDSCPLVLHESCLGTGACYDTTEKFYCPFCAHSRAISKCEETKKKVSLARKDLRTFICLATQRGHSHMPCRDTEYQSKQDDGLPRTSNAERDVSNRHNERRKKWENEQAGCSKLSTDRVAKSRRQVSQSPEVHEEHQMARRPSHKSRDENAVCQVSRRSDVCKKNHTEISSMKAITYHPATDLHHENKSPSSSDSVDSEEMSDEEAEDETICCSKYPIRIKKQKKKLFQSQNRRNNPATQRRIRLPWTSAEEDLLTRAVRLLSSPHDRAMPWTRILEFGAGVFQNRTAPDLKDKWRNMCKASKIT